MKIDRYTLLRYFTGESTEEEKEAIRQWLESDEVHREQFVREQIRFDATVLAHTGDATEKAESSGVKRRVLYNLLKVASVILLVISCSYFYNNYRMKKLGETMQSVYVPAGSRSMVNLSEGSIVWLNSNTTFYYPGLFNDERLVEIHGEGFFDIAKDETRPFIIHSNKYNLEVLGTSFNLESYPDNAFFETALFTGSVKLYKSQEGFDTVFLKAGETATLINDRLVVSATNSAKYRWREGLIVIEDKSFEEMMILFEKYFDLKIIIQTDDVKKLGYWGKFRMVDGIDHAMRVLQRDYRFKYKREEDSNVIYIY